MDGWIIGGVAIALAMIYSFYIHWRAERQHRKNMEGILKACALKQMISVYHDTFEERCRIERLKKGEEE